jgi:hypothetical protein
MTLWFFETFGQRLELALWFWKSFGYKYTLPLPVGSMFETIRTSEHGKTPWNFY